MENAKFLRRVNIDDYYGDQTVTIGASSDTIENIPLETSIPAAYEFEIEGKRIVFIGYETKT